MSFFFALFHSLIVSISIKYRLTHHKNINIIGHDFRPAYRKLSWLRSTFSSVPCLAATATATPRVIEDIREVLQFTKEEKCLKSTFNRENITYEVRYKDAMVRSSYESFDYVNATKKNCKLFHNLAPHV